MSDFSLVQTQWAALSCSTAQLLSCSCSHLLVLLLDCKTSYNHHPQCSSVCLDRSCSLNPNNCVDCDDDGCVGANDDGCSMNNRVDPRKAGPKVVGAPRQGCSTLLLSRSNHYLDHHHHLTICTDQELIMWRTDHMSQSSRYLYIGRWLVLLTCRSWSSSSSKIDHFNWLLPPLTITIGHHHQLII